MEGMAKETVSTRLPLAVAEQVDDYAKTHEISRTEAMERLAREGVENPENAEGERRYTGVIRQKFIDQANTPRRDPDSQLSEIVKQSLETQLRPRETLPDEYDETVARSARFPQDLAGRLKERAESQDSSKAVVTAEAIETGLRADPIPVGAEDGRDGQVCTVVLDREMADLFRKHRLYNRSLPGEVFEASMMWTNSSKIGYQVVQW